MAFKRSDMKHDHYKWKAFGGDDPKVTGKPDSTLKWQNRFVQPS